MKPLPDLSDDGKMALRGRRSTLASARNEAAEELRNVYVRVQQCGYDSIQEQAGLLRQIADRLDQLADLWRRAA